MTRTAQTPSRAKAETALPTRLSLQWLLSELVAAGLIPPDAPGKISLPPGKKGTEDRHPLVIAAAQDWPDRRHEGNRLTIEALTQWLAHRVRLPYLRIDPLTLEVGKLTEVVPYAYASRVGILPIKTGPQGILFAVKDPLALDWMRELQPALRVPLSRSRSAGCSYRTFGSIDTTYQRLPCRIDPPSGVGRT
jgi:general secretion pathway protein E